MENTRARIDTYIIAIYITCFAIGVATHGVDFLRLGWRPYRYGPLPFEVFWTALLLLDASVVALLALGKRRLGLILALTIMTLDVVANSYAHLTLNIPGFAVPLILQTCFFGFILGSIAYVWPKRQAHK